MSRLRVAFLVLLSALSAGAGEKGTVAPLTRIADVRGLTREEAAKGLPVRITGTCVWRGLGDLVVHDGEQGIWVAVMRAAQQPEFTKNSDPGDLVVGAGLEIEGITDPGGFAPVVIPSRIRGIGPLPLPKARRIPTERLLSGSEDGQFVELEGVVQDASMPWGPTGAAQIVMMVDGHFCRIFGPNGKNFQTESLVDARIRVRGIFAADSNMRSEALNLKLLITDENDIDIVIPPPGDPFLAPRVALNRLMPFSPEARPYHRKVISGVVTFALPGQFFFVQDGETSVRVSSADAHVRPGWRVDAAGFVDLSHSFASLKNARVRLLEQAPVPPPLPTTAESLMKPRGPSVWLQPGIKDASGQAVVLGGLLRRIDWKGGNEPEALWFEAGGRMFSAYLPFADQLSPEVLKSWRPGAEIELTGVCELEFTRLADIGGNYLPVGFHLWLSSPASVRVISLPPWWTPFRLTLALGGVGLAALLLLGWTWMLRRQVERQTRVISGKIRTEATQEERARIARDLHDTVEQQLAGVSLQLFGARESLADDPRSAANSLDLARRMLKHTQRETRSSIRDMRSPLLERKHLGEALRLLAEEAGATGHPVVEVLATGDHPLPQDIEYQLLRLAQESLANALKHARAGKITITLDSTIQGVRLGVADDGCGFHPAALDFSDPSHFGMLGMRERADKLGGEFSVTSEPGKGCVVTVLVPPSPSSAR